MNHKINMDYAMEVNIMYDFNDYEDDFQDEDAMRLTITMDDDEEVECSIVAIFPVEDKDYIALNPIESEIGEVLLYRFIPLADDADGFSLRNIEDDEEFSAVVDAYDELMSGNEYEDDEYEDDEYEDDEYEDDEYEDGDVEVYDTLDDNVRKRLYDND
jgi:hypothetical protein